MDSGAAHVVAIPIPGRGHINPMMTACVVLASHGVLVTVVLTEEWLGLLPPPVQRNIQFRSIPNVVPSERIRGLDFDGYVEAILTNMEVPFEQLLDGLNEESAVTGILADGFLPWAVAVGNRRNLPVYSMFMQAASVFTVYYHYNLLLESKHLPASLSERGEELVDYIPGIKSTRIADLPSLCFSKRLLNRTLDCVSWTKKAHCLLLTSFYELEPCVIEVLRASLPLPVYPIGPSIPYMTLKEQVGKPISPTNNIDYLAWLDSQQKTSVLYVSLGSCLPVSGAQMEEFALGLDASRTPFLWVVRENSSAAQIVGGGKGMTVPWCEQLRVLCHPSIGGFLTHCGWNSTLEGVYAGLPMLAFPMLVDQFPNSKLIVDDWKVGLRLKEQSDKEHLVKKEEIEKYVQMLMDLDGDVSKEIRVRAKHLQVACHGALDKDGSSFRNFSLFIRDVKGCSN